MMMDARNWDKKFNKIHDIYGSGGSPMVFSLSPLLLPLSVHVILKKFTINDPSSCVCVGV